jgi:hypothetical protein
VVSIIFGAHSFPLERISSLKKIQFLGTSFGSRQKTLATDNRLTSHLWTPEILGGKQSSCLMCGKNTKAPPHKSEPHFVTKTLREG